MEKENIKKGKKYLLIGVLILFLAILGSSVAYYLARVQGSLSGKTAGMGLSLAINKVSNTDGDLIPLDNDVETLNQAILGYGNTSNNFDSAKACLDINNYSVCQVYKVTLTNNGTVPVTVNSKVELSGAGTPNIDCTKMDDEKSVSNGNSCIGNNTLANNDTINGNKSKDYYVVVYIKNLDVPQTDSGDFNGTITFTSTQGDQVKGRFKQGDTLVEHITKLYTDNKDYRVTNNEIEYQYATSVNLMNDRLGGTTTLLDGGNIRFYGATPNNYIDIGDKYEGDVTKGNWESLPGFPVATSDECHALLDNNSTFASSILNATEYATVDEFCSVSTTPAGTPILWRIIGIFDGKLRIRRNDNIGSYSFDTSSSDVNGGNGINEWSQADLMKLLNPSYVNNKDLNSNNEEITVNNSLYWNSESGICYNGVNNATTECNFTNAGLSEKAKEYVVDQTLYLGGFDAYNDVYSNQAWTIERDNNVYNIENSQCQEHNLICNDIVERTLLWTGKVGLIYPSDFGYASDFSDANCQGNFGTFFDDCKKNWMMQGGSWTISSWSKLALYEIGVSSGSMQLDVSAGYGLGGWPTLTLDPSLLFDDTTDGSLERPYKIVD